MTSPHKHPLSGADVLNFLRMFEGAAATFGRTDRNWSLWLPEFPADEYPLTPASKVFFPVILRQDEQALAIRFFYDCSTGKVRYYTSALPDEIARLPEFENAISELFRHTLPVEPIRQRVLNRRHRATFGEPPPPRPRAPQGGSLADPAEPSRAIPPAAPPVETLTVRVTPPAKPVVTTAPKPAMKLAPVSVSSPSVPPREIVIARREGPEDAAHVRHVRVEIGPHARSVIIAFLVTIALLGLGALGVQAYLRASEDPGVMHHRLQLEEMRLRNGGN